MSYKSQDYYEFLGVSKDASEADIKKAYRKLAIQLHPDKGGDVEKFQHLGDINSILSDPEKRKLYDLGGMDAVNNPHQHGDGGADIFDLFGGGRRRQQAPRGPRKDDPVVFPMQLTLEEMYTGLTKKLRVTRTVCCSSCDGKGGANVVTCAPCQGRGVKVVVQRLGPGMISQSQQTCGQCRGEGKMIAPGKECLACQGQKVVKEKKQLDVTVTPGARSGQTVTFPSEGDQTPGNLPGDIIVEFQEKPHDRFQRKGHHLFYTQRITLLEALTGFTLFIKHFNHEVKIESKSVIKPGDVMCIADEGFPHSFGNGRGMESGNLYVTFNVEFPTTQEMQANKQSTKLLQQALPHNSSLRKAGEANAKVHVAAGRAVDMTVEDRKMTREEQEWSRHQQQQSRQHIQDDDDEGGHVHMGGMGGQGCQQL